MCAERSFRLVSADRRRVWSSGPIEILRRRIDRHERRRTITNENRCAWRDRVLIRMIIARRGAGEKLSGRCAGRSVEVSTGAIICRVVRLARKAVDRCTASHVAEDY